MQAPIPAHSPDAPERPAGSIMLAPLGISLQIEVERPDEAHAVLAACHGWSRDERASTPSLRIALSVRPHLSGADGAQVRVSGRQMRLQGRGVEGGADADSRFARCGISGDYLAAPSRLREDVLDPLALFLLTRNGRTPIHAAGFVAGDVALLAAGPSGAGKSCLALAADAAGWAVLSDDTVYLESGPPSRIWGWPGAVHLLPSDCVDRTVPTRSRGGRIKHAVPLRTAARSAARAVLCVLARGPAAALDRLDPAEALERLAPVEPGFDLLAGEIAAAHRALVRNGAWRLTLSPDPREAIGLVAANLGRLRTTAA